MYIVNVYVYTDNVMINKARISCIDSLLYLMMQQCQ